MLSFRCCGPFLVTAIRNFAIWKASFAEDLDETFGLCGKCRNPSFVGNICAGDGFSQGPKSRLSLRPEKGTESFFSLALASFCIENSLQPFLLDVNLVV